MSIELDPAELGFEREAIFFLFLFRLPVQRGKPSYSC